MTIDRKDWRKYDPPWIPIFYIDIEELKRMLKESPDQLSPVSLEIMLGAFEELEMYEKAAIVKAHYDKIGWRLEGENWVRPMTAEELQGMQIDDTWTDNGDGTWTKEIDEDDAELFEL